MLKTRPESAHTDGGPPPHVLPLAWRRRVYEIIEIGQGDDRLSRIVDAAIVGLILINIAAFVAETVAELARRYGVWFHAFETFSVVIFSIVLAELDAQQVAEVPPLLRAHNLPPHVEVIPAGGLCDAMYFVASRSVQRRPSPADEVFKTADFFGIAAMLEGEPSRGAFVTTSRCRLLKLFPENFHRLETAPPAIAEVLRAAANRNRPKRPRPGWACPGASPNETATAAPFNQRGTATCAGLADAPMSQTAEVARSLRRSRRHASPISLAATTTHPARHPVRQSDAHTRPDRSRWPLPILARPTRGRAQHLGGTDRRHRRGPRHYR